MSTFNYHCFNTADRDNCNDCSKIGQVQIEEKGDFTCPCNNSALKLLGEVSSISIKTPTRDRFLEVSRKKRNKDHFRREVLPSIADTDSQKHHIKKLGYKS